MLHLITGTPGSGKTLYAVSLIMRYVKENEILLKEGKDPRPIYADIDGLNIPGVEVPPEDWRETPEHSVIFYDEIQQRESYKKHKNDNDIVNALQVHRQTGHDIYGITQFPTLLHPNFKAVVGLHYHLHRGWGLSAATVYQWAYCVDAPNAPSNKRLAEHSFRFSYPKDLYKVYKSASQHTHKTRIPKKFIIIILFVLVAGYFTYNQLFNKQNFLTQTLSGKTAKPASAPASTSAPGKPSSAPAATSAPGSAPASTPLSQQQQLEQKYLPSHIVEFSQNDDIRPASVIAFGTDCTAYNKYGEILMIDNALCKKLLKPGMMPKPRQNQSDSYIQQTPQTAPATVSTPSPGQPSSAPASTPAPAFGINIK